MGCVVILERVASQDLCFWSTFDFRKREYRERSGRWWLRRGSLTKLVIALFEPFRRTRFTLYTSSINFFGCWIAALI